MIATITSGRILFAGGCHVNGYPIGESSSFSEISANALGYPSSRIDRIAPIGLGNCSRLFEYLERNRPPDIAVLQFGNYEVPRPLGKHARSVLTGAFGPKIASKTSFSSSKRPWHSLPPGHIFEPSLTWDTRMLVKRTYAAAAQHMSPPLFDADAVRERLRWVLSHLAPFEIPVTVVLSPLPCADHMARQLRIAAASIFQEVSARAGVLSLNTATALGYASRSAKRPFDIYADERHLNRHGHELLALALVGQLEPHIAGSQHVQTESLLPEDGEAVLA